MHKITFKDKFRKHTESASFTLGLPSGHVLTFVQGVATVEDDAIAEEASKNFSRMLEVQKLVAEGVVVKRVKKVASVPVFEPEELPHYDDVEDVDVSDDGNSVAEFSHDEDEEGFAIGEIVSDEDAAEKTVIRTPKLKIGRGKPKAEEPKKRSVKRGKKK